MPIWSALLLGFVGSLHCAGMCGPLVFALHRGGSGLNRLAYHSGRILTYAILGGILGMLGLAAQVAGLQKFFSLVLGLALIASIVIPLFSARFQAHYLTAKTGGWLSARVNKWRSSAMEMRGMTRQFALGLLNGLLPCGMVYIAIGGALSLANYLQSGLYMILFGLGTWPMLLVISFGGGFVQKFRWVSINRLTPAHLAGPQPPTGASPKWKPI